MTAESRHLLTVLLLLATLTMAFSKSADLSKQEMAALDTITQGTSKFAVSLFRALSSKQSGNVFVSPLSVQMVLALAYTGAKGETASELAKLLSLPEKAEDTLTGYRSLIQILQNPVLKLANRMFVEKTATIKEEFQKNAKMYFQSPAESLDFRGASDVSRQHINSWVEEQTNKKITNLLAPGVISRDTMLVLVNAIHFKADWQNKFLESNTKEEPFHVSKTEDVQVQMMHIKKKFGFRHDKELKAKILELSYEGREFRMLVILPDAVDGLPELEAKLENVNLSETVRYMEQTTVTVVLPKFKMEETMELNEILKSLGARSMFSDQTANFSGLSDEKLTVSKVVQKAFVEVNEKGTEAAAATAGVIRLRRSLEMEVEFKVDHPFVFFISHSPSNSVFFVGRVCHPQSVRGENVNHDEL